MSIAEAMRFFHDAGNNHEIADRLKRIRDALQDADGSIVGGRPVPAVAAHITGDQFGYYFSVLDFIHAAPAMKRIYDRALQATGQSTSFAAGGATDAGADEGRLAPMVLGKWNEGMADEMGWEDGEAGAMLGDMILSYWDEYEDQWGVPAPENWIHLNVNW